MNIHLDETLKTQGSEKIMNLPIGTNWLKKNTYDILSTNARLKTVKDLINYGFDELYGYLNLKTKNDFNQSNELMSDVQNSLALFKLKLKDSEFDIYDVSVDRLHFETDVKQKIKKTRLFDRVNDFFIPKLKLRNAIGSANIVNVEKALAELGLKLYKTTPDYRREIQSFPLLHKFENSDYTSQPQDSTNSLATDNSSPSKNTDFGVDGKLSDFTHLKKVEEKRKNYRAENIVYEVKNFGLATFLGIDDENINTFQDIDKINEAVKYYISDKMKAISKLKGMDFIESLNELKNEIENDYYPLIKRLYIRFNNEKGKIIVEMFMDNNNSHQDRCNELEETLNKLSKIKHEIDLIITLGAPASSKPNQQMQ